MSTSKPATEAIKLCKDCKWMEPCKHGYHKCKYPEIIDLVTGEWRAEYGFCSVMRSGNSNCGLKGKYFESKIEVRDVTPPIILALPNTQETSSFTQLIKRLFT